MDPEIELERERLLAKIKDLLAETGLDNQLTKPAECHKTVHNDVSTLSEYFALPKFSKTRVDRAEGKGRVLLAVNDFKPGEGAFSEPAVVWASRDENTCMACECLGHATQKCPLYQRQYSAFLDSVVSDIHVIAARGGVDPLVVKMATKALMLSIDETFDLWWTLEMHAENLDDCEETAKAMFERVREHAQDAAERLIARMPLEKLTRFISILSTNVHGISNLNGGGLFPMAAMIEHNCKPNCSYTTEGNTMHVTAIEPIKAGEALSFSYVPSYHPTATRQKNLLKRYAFLCNCDLCLAPTDKCRAFVCPACLKSKPTATTNNGVLPQQDRTVGVACAPPRDDAETDAAWECDVCKYHLTPEERQRCLQREAEEGALKPTEVDLKKVLSESVLHESHHIVFWALDHQVDILMDREKHREAEEYLVMILRCADRVLQKFDVTKASYYDMLGDVRKALGDKDGMRAAYRKAYEIRRIACREDLPATVKAKEKFKASLYE